MSGEREVGPGGRRRGEALHVALEAQVLDGDEAALVPPAVQAAVHDARVARGRALHVHAARRAVDVDVQDVAVRVAFLQDGVLNLHPQ